MVTKATDSPRLVYLRNDTPLYFSWQAANLSHSRFMDLSVGFPITLSKWEPEAVYGRTFTKTCQYPPIQQSAHSGSFPRFPKPVQRRLKTRQKLRLLANLLIGLLSRLLRHHDVRKLQPVIITLRWLELGSSRVIWSKIQESDGRNQRDEFSQREYYIAIHYQFFCTWVKMSS